MAASYPGAVKTFAARSAGQVIDASHVNDLQDEVNAIEAGLLNATAPLNSSNSTVAALSVSGASTFASRPVMPPPDAVRVPIGSTLAVVDAAAAVAINWIGTADYKTNSTLHSTARNSSRVTPQSTGIYRLTAQVALSTATAAGYRSLYINDSTTTIGVARAAGTTGNVTILQAHATKRVDVVGTYFVILVDQNTGSTLSVLAADSWVAMEKL